MNVKPIRLFRPHRYYEGEPDVIDVYPVGFYSDVRRLLMALRMGHWWDISYQVRRIARSWRRRSYWNGYLAEVGHPVALCGHGWTRRRALLSLEAVRLQGFAEPPPERAILTDLIAQLRETAATYPGATGRLLMEMAGSAEARLREVQGE